MPSAEPDLLTRLNLETGTLGWNELERHFARGSVVKVAVQTDMLEVAAAMARDDKAAISAWIENGSIARADDDDARRWMAAIPTFWAVVVAPWVLVQESHATAVAPLSVN